MTNTDTFSKANEVFEVAANMIKVECDQCGGYGYVPLEEDDRMVEHACYRCGTDGYHLYTEQQYCDMVNDLVAEATAKRR